MGPDLHPNCLQRSNRYSLHYLKNSQQSTKAEKKELDVNYDI